MSEGLLELLRDHGLLGLALLSFFEAICIPIPPDTLMIPVALLKPQYALFYAALAIVCSTAGAIGGRWIGLKAGRPVLRHFASEKFIGRVETWFARYGAWALAIAALIPAPFKVFTIASGVSGMALRPVVTGVLVGRTVRFGFEGAVIMLLGEAGLDFLDHYSGSIYLALGIVLVLALLGFWLHRRKSRSEATRPDTEQGARS